MKRLLAIIASHAPRDNLRAPVNAVVKLIFRATPQHHLLCGFSLNTDTRIQTQEVPEAPIPLKTKETFEGWYLLDTIVYITAAGMRVRRACSSSVHEVMVVFTRRRVLKRHPGAGIYNRVSHVRHRP